MKGQRLFMRPFDESDREHIAEFLAREHPAMPVPACGLLGKLVGDLVAVVAFDVEHGRSLKITGIVVAERLRRKRIGRALVEETFLFARKLECESVRVSVGLADRFFEQNGFTVGDETLFRRV